jgi:hypothetical protein
MRDNDGQWRKDRRNASMVHPERSDRRRRGIRDRGKQ